MTETGNQQGLPLNEQYLTMELSDLLHWLYRGSRGCVDGTYDGYSPALRPACEALSRRGLDVVPHLAELYRNVHRDDHRDENVRNMVGRSVAFVVMSILEAIRYQKLELDEALLEPAISLLDELRLSEGPAEPFALAALLSTGRFTGEEALCYLDRLHQQLPIGRTRDNPAFPSPDISTVLSIMFYDMKLRWRQGVSDLRGAAAEVAATNEISVQRDLNLNIAALMDPEDYARSLVQILSGANGNESYTVRYAAAALAQMLLKGGVPAGVEIMPHQLVALLSRSLFQLQDEDALIPRIAMGLFAVASPIAAQLSFLQQGVLNASEAGTAIGMILFFGTTERADSPYLNNMLFTAHLVASEGEALQALLLAAATYIERASLIDELLKRAVLKKALLSLDSDDIHIAFQAARCLCYLNDGTPKSRVPNTAFPRIAEIITEIFGTDGSGAEKRAAKRLLSRERLHTLWS